MGRNRDKLTDRLKGLAEDLAKKSSKDFLELHIQHLKDEILKVQEAKLQCVLQERTLHEQIKSLHNEYCSDLIPDYPYRLRSYVKYKCITKDTEGFTNIKTATMQVTNIFVQTRFGGISVCLDLEIPETKAGVRVETNTVGEPIPNLDTKRIFLEKIEEEESDNQQS